MKKTIIFFSTAILACFIFSSCKKDADPAPSADPDYVGLWKGKYGSTTGYPAQGYAFLFRNNGTVRVFDGTDTAAVTKAEGTYSITGSTVNTTYTYLGGTNKFSTTAIMDAKYTFQEGTYGTGVNTTNGGRFFLVKQ